MFPCFLQKANKHESFSPSMCLRLVIGPGLVFREHGHPLAYGLSITNPSTLPMMRAILMTIQAQILRTLLFDSAILKLPKTW